MEDARRVKFNVGGRSFETTWATLKRIPTLYHMMTDCQDQSELFIDRSPMLFEQVFAFVVDEKHPFPLRYSYELDWYDVVYDKSKLFDDEAWMPIQCRNQKFYASLLQSAIGVGPGQNQWKNCIKVKCGEELSNKWKPICKKCDDYCIEPSCTKLSTKNSNYCPDHQKTNLLCNKKGCFHSAVAGYSKYCGSHTRVPEIKNI